MYAEKGTFDSVMVVELVEVELEAVEAEFEGIERDGFGGNINLGVEGVGKEAIEGKRGNSE